MYTLVSAIGKSLTNGEKWSAIDLGNMTFATVIQNYSTVYAVLSNPFLPGNVSLNLNKVLPKIGNQFQTFNAYLAGLGNTALPTSPTVPTLATKYARYQDGFRAGYTITPISSRASVSAPLPTSEKSDLLLTRSDINYETFYESCLVSINGFFHLIDTDKQSGVWVTDGMKSCIHSKRNKLGIVSFQDLGTLTHIPITSDMFFKQKSTQSYANHAYLNLGRDLTNYTVMVVIGGYLHVLDSKTVRMIGTNSIMIDFNNLPLFERYFESKPYIDLSALPLTSYPNNSEAFAVSDMLSDNFIEAYLTLSQSFVVLIDNTDLWTDLVRVRAAKFPNLYVSHVEPQWPLIAGFGKVSEYWSVEEDGQWALTTEDTLRDNYLFNTVQAKRQVTLTDSRNPMNPRDLSPAFFLRIGCDIDVTG
jgi:hypothetical protein